MKIKRLLLASALIGIGFFGKAQQVEIIPKIGVNFSKQNIGNLDGEKMRTRIQSGVGVKFNTNIQNFSIQPELNYIGKGTRLKNGNVKTDLDLNYLELPVLAKYSFGPVYVNAGPSIGLLMDKESKVIKNYGEKLKKLDFGLQMGAGVAVPLGMGKVIVDARYNLGLSDLGKQTSIKNRGIMASIGYAIPLK
ncbi:MULTISPECIES: porin family protein [Sphingobacterium]|uniref:porin family protein n=1 Tax=Sphingobacterium TaxID=28453 RepID=UPI00257B9B5A|nr:MULTISPECIES: porin family protein [Sphingobacterium]